MHDLVTPELTDTGVHTVRLEAEYTKLKPTVANWSWTYRYMCLHHLRQNAPTWHCLSQLGARHGRVKLAPLAARASLECGHVA